MAAIVEDSNGPSLERSDPEVVAMAAAAAAGADNSDSESTGESVGGICVVPGDDAVAAAEAAYRTGEVEIEGVGSVRAVFVAYFHPQVWLACLRVCE